MEVAQLQIFVLTVVVPTLIKLLLALVVWLVGRRVIELIVTLTQRGFQRQRMDSTAASYLSSTVRVLLTVALVVGVISLLGIETTSFAALLAGAGLAIGAAISGLLGNFAAGLLMLVLRPFKVGDQIEGGGVTGVVKEIGMVTTVLDTVDGLQVIVGNNKLFGDNITNFSANLSRVAAVSVEIDGDHDHGPILEQLSIAARAIQHVEISPAPTAFISAFKTGPVVTTHVHCHHDYYLQVLADLHRVVKETLIQQKVSGPIQSVRMIAT